MAIELRRVRRFNAWDLIGNGHAVLHELHRSLRPWPVVLMAFTLVVTALACDVLLRLNRAVLLVRCPGPPPVR